MRKIPIFGFTCLLLLGLCFSIHPAEAKITANSPFASTAQELVDAVNTLRTSNGLPAYQENNILMTIAQQHAEYMASIHVGNVHTDAQGRRPFQRALDAGYMVAGDLSQGGWFSENVVLGKNLSAQGAVDIWMGDAPHQLTMLSDVLKDVGAGVAVDGDNYYYCLDVGLSTGGTPVAYTPLPPLISPTPTILINTPEADGLITYVVQPGDTVLAIAIGYGVSVNDINRLNGLSSSSFIFAGQKLVIRSANTPTPTEPTSTPSLLPTPTLWPTSTATSTDMPPSPTSPAAAGLPVAKAGQAVAIIAGFALLAAGVVTLAGFINRKKK